MNMRRLSFLTGVCKRFEHTLRPRAVCGHWWRLSSTAASGATEKKNGEEKVDELSSIISKLTDGTDIPHTDAQWRSSRFEDKYAAKAARKRVWRASGKAFKDGFSQQLFDCANVRELEAVLDTRRRDDSLSEGQYNSAIRKCLELAAFDKCWQLHAEAKAHAKVGPVTYNTLIYACAMQSAANGRSANTSPEQNAALLKAMDLFVECATLGFEPTDAMYTQLLSLCTRLRAFATGKSIWRELRRSTLTATAPKRKAHDYEDDLKELSTLADSITKQYPNQTQKDSGKKGDLEKNEKLLENSFPELDDENFVNGKNELRKRMGSALPKKQIELSAMLWTAAIELFVQSRDMRTALQLFDEYSKVTVSGMPDSVFGSILNGLAKAVTAHNGDGSYVRMAHLKKLRRDDDVRSAEQLFAQYLEMNGTLPCKKVFSAMMDVYAANGYVYQCISLFTLLFDRHLMTNAKDSLSLKQASETLHFALKKMEANVAKKSGKKVEMRPQYWAEVRRLLADGRVHGSWLATETRGNNVLDSFCVTIAVKSLICHWQKSETYLKLEASGWAQVSAEDVASDKHLYLTKTLGTALTDCLLQVATDGAVHGVEANHILLGLLCRSCLPHAFFGQSQAQTARAKLFYERLTASHCVRPQSLELFHLLQVFLAPSELSQATRSGLLRFVAAEMIKYKIPQSRFFTSLLKRNHVNLAIFNQT